MINFMPVQTTIIDENWQVAQRLAPNRDLFLSEGGEKNWLPAHVPGHVHTDLMKAGVIGDPFYRMQELGCQWVDEADWTYRTTFDVSAERLASRGTSGRHFLHFGGLDTICRVFLNGVQIGQAENFFTSHRFDVTETLREGENDLRVEFDSALRVGRERARRLLGRWHERTGESRVISTLGHGRLFASPQYMFGWDWGPGTRIVRFVAGRGTGHGSPCRNRGLAHGVRFYPAYLGYYPFTNHSGKIRRCTAHGGGVAVHGRGQHAGRPTSRRPGSSCR